MITSGQLRAARALLNMDRKTLAELSGLSVPTIQRMETAEDLIGGNVESLNRVMDTLKRAGIELIDEGSSSQGGGRGVRLTSASADPDPS